MFALLGGGQQKKTIEKIIRDENLSNNFFMPGDQKRDIVAKFRAAADVNLCLMAGYSLIEAAVSARPIVSYDVEWHYELVKNGLTGALIKEGNVEGVVSAIIDFLSNEKKAEEFGKNARKIAVARHSLKSSSAIKVKYYKELLEK